MLDQSFSADNFRKILDYENRKGQNLESKYFPEIFKITKAISELNKKTKKELNDEKRKELRELRIELKRKKEDKLQEELNEVSKKVIDRNFKFELKKIEIKDDKPFYSVEDMPEAYFSMKQIQRNVAKLYKVRQAGRPEIVSQVMCLLGDGFPKYVIRTDIESFYESIPHDKLLQKINEDNLLTFFSKRIIAQIIEDYKVKAASAKGIPRGIGVSAYLSEIYMRDVDAEIKALPNVTYYARYVDDIIIIFTPPPTNEDTKTYMDAVRKIVEDKDLKLNSKEKTKEFDLRNSNKCHRLDYLGYRIFFGKGTISVRLSKKKMEKYKKRIDLSLESYIDCSKVNEKKARKLLVKRLRFLTGNTKLQGNKKNILVGIYYSHNLLTDPGDLVGLDKYMNYKIDSLIRFDPLKIRLKELKFQEGFETRRFSPFTTKELSEIMSVWKNIKV